MASGITRAEINEGFDKAIKLMKQDNSTSTGSIHHVLQKELQRRKQAFTTLILSIMAGLAVSLLDLLISKFVITAGILAIFFILLLLSRMLLFRFFDRFARSRLMVNDTNAVWLTGNTEEKIAFSDIAALAIKRTIQGPIRQLRIKLNTGKVYYISGLEGLEQIKNLLVEKCDKLKNKEFKETIDFDHPAFYIVFGLLVSISSIVTIRALASFNPANIKYIIIMLLVYNIPLGIYICITRPLASSFGKKARNADYFLGISIILAVALIVLFYIL